MNYRHSCFILTILLNCANVSRAQNVITYPIGEFKNAEAHSEQLCADDPFICDLLNKYSPKFIFHPNERFFPSTVDYFLDHSTLRYRYSKKNTKEILGLGEVSGSNLGIQIHGADGTQTLSEVGRHQPSFRKSRTRGEYYVEVAEEHRNKVFKGFDPNQLDETLTLYANYGKLYDDQTFMGYQLQYWLFFPNNGSIGYHEGDWEGISVTVDTTGKFIYATYMSHGRSGTYLPEQIIFADSIGNEQKKPDAHPDSTYSHPVVFISKSMHASFPDAKVRRRWKFIIPLPSDKTKRGVAFNSSGRVQLLPNRFMATKSMKWVQFAGRWGSRSTKLFNSPDSAPNKRPYYRGTWFRHKDTKRRSELRARGIAIGSSWGRLRFEPRIPICDIENRWLILVSRNDIRLQQYAELFRRDDPAQKYHNLDLYNFDNVITGIVACRQSEDTYLLFDEINYGGRKQEVTWSGGNIEEEDRIENNDRISSICWDQCENSNWVSFFKNSDFKGTSYFLNGVLNTSVNDFEQTNVGGSTISSIRFCLPEGQKLVLYDQPNFNFAKYKLELVGDGTFTEIDFENDNSEMENAIQSARILPTEKSLN